LIARIHFYEILKMLRMTDVSKWTTRINPVE